MDILIEALKPQEKERLQKVLKVLPEKGSVSLGKNQRYDLYDELVLLPGGITPLIRALDEPEPWETEGEEEYVLPPRPFTEDTPPPTEEELDNLPF